MHTHTEKINNEQVKDPKQGTHQQQLDQRGLQGKTRMRIRMSHTNARWASSVQDSRAR